MTVIATSLIIPTLNRPNDLKRCLDSIAKLNQNFDEIIIVEQGNFDLTETIAQQFINFNISVYFYDIKSLTRARNFGIKKAQGEFIFFVDDDTELDKDYVTVAMSYLAKNPKVLGISGPINNYRANLLGHITKTFSTLIGLNSFQNKILASGKNTSALYNKEQAVQWLCGGHVIYRKIVFDEGLTFNPDFIRWSLGEDVMLSYQVYKRYGKGSLMYVPEFKLMHYDSDEISLTNKSIVRMAVIYRFIFWKKEVYKGSRLSLIYYLYSQIGVALTEIRRVKNKLEALFYLIKSYQYLLKNWKAIESNKIDYNQFILYGDK